ncbi:uncharacterized protein LOC143068729 [Mytilus galloprovincialis]|uniref:uncharacterized protein LOC143068729 n=1 Tax=Mytilus galloprovincialis TaxID=29158 RepID=UPI003F7BDCDA
MDSKHSRLKRDIESLFSLEVVVEKIYIPHEVCRFPSVAFRLLDYPTILIDHVEHDLASKIRRKVSSDPYYELPKQINELTDKHGNFELKKGKSCLLKLPFNTMQTHLSNTPMYVMIIDSYPQVPKLLGNTTVPLDEVIKDIAEDIRKVGDTVPSVHGDKGLFKVFNLMGKEIGYIILGYRLMCLGSGLIPHIPEREIAKRQSESIQEHSQQIEESIQEQYHAPTKSNKSASTVQRAKTKESKKLSTSQDMGSMTDPEKHDVLMQTIDMCDKEIHVALSDINTKKPRDLQTVSTQTQKKLNKNRKEPKLVSIELKPPADDSDDEFIINNIVHPPPLFYNSENEPRVKIQRPYLYYQDDASSVYTDELTIDDFSDEEKTLISKPPRNVPPQKVPSTKPRTREENQVKIQQPSAEKAPALGQFQSLMLGFPGSMTNGPLFPMLTALLNELSKIQDPRFVQSAVNQVNVATQDRQQPRPCPVPQPRMMTQKSEIINSPNKSKLHDNKENIQAGEKDVQLRGRKTNKVFTTPSDGVSKKKGWIRKTPNVSVSKSKLAYGLTNTQRLRLAKVNPEWLKTIEKEEKEAKALKAKTFKREDEEFEKGNLSDTLTEVRRLAEKNLNQMDDTVEQNESNFDDTVKSTMKKNRRRISPPRKPKPSAPSPVRKRSKSPKHKYLSKVQISSKSESRDDDFTTSGQIEKEEHVSDEEDAKSFKSIEVRIPSAQMYEDDSDFADSPKSYKYPGHMDKSRSEESSPNDNKFPGFMDHNVSVPASINGKTNESLNSTRDHYYEHDEEDYQPLESTRYSKPNKSHDEIDTQQFQSTEEPELQKLMSSGEKSEVSDILSTSRSEVSPNVIPPFDYNMTAARFQVLNPKASIQSPLPAIRKSQTKLDESGRTSPVVTPRSPGSSRHPTPTPRKKTAQRKRMDFKPDSIHTESVSSYIPSDEEDILGNDGYSDDFNDNSSSRMSPIVSHSNKWIPSTKLGYTIS